MKNYMRRIVLFPVLWLTMPVFSMDDNSQKEKDRKPKVTKVLRLPSQGRVNHRDLFNAAQTIPEVYSESHFCIKELEGAYSLFSVEHNAYKNKTNTSPTESIVLAERGERACEGAIHFIKKLMFQMKKNELQCEKEKQEITEMHDEKLEQQRIELENIKKEKKAHSDQSENDKKEALGKYLKQVNENKEQSCLLEKYDVALRDFTKEKNRYKAAFFACATGFLGYFLWTQWKSGAMIR